MDLAWIDGVGLGIVGAFLILGFVRGLWWQVIRAAGLFAAVIVARAASPALAGWVAHQWPDLSTRSAGGIAWGALFLLALCAATLLGLLGRRLLEVMQLGLADRVGGAAVGAVTGLGLHVALLVLLCQLGTEAYVARTLGGTKSERVVDAVGARYPVVLGKEAGAEVDLLLQRARGLSPYEQAPPHGIGPGLAPHALVPQVSTPPVEPQGEALVPYQESPDPEPAHKAHQENPDPEPPAGGAVVH
jgi:uncharacterized membrane protein required for colicin V production